MPKTKKVINPIFIVWVIASLIGFSFGLMVFPTEDVERDTTFNDSALTATGTFDRVELVDRHFGRINGQEVEGEVLAVIYETGTVLVSTDHYDVRRLYEAGNTYTFFLYVYDGINHLRERISVEGGVLEWFLYSNVTISISLDQVEGTVLEPDYAGYIGVAFIWFIGGIFGFLAATTEPSIKVKVRENG